MARALSKAAEGLLHSGGRREKILRVALVLFIPRVDIRDGLKAGSRWWAVTTHPLSREKPYDGCLKKALRQAALVPTTCIFIISHGVMWRVEVV